MGRKGGRGEILGAIKRLKDGRAAEIDGISAGDIKKKNWRDG